MKYFNVGNCFIAILFFVFPSNAEGIQESETDTLQPYIEEGRALFVGTTRLVNGGPSCLSCHTINDADLSLSGGTLAINVTAFGSLPTDALQERIINVPYPHMVVMKAAYTNNPVTEQEANKIITYLKHIAEQQAGELTPLLAGLNFLWAGLAVFLVFLGIIWLSWRGHKKESINEEIYQRQIQSV